MNAVTTMRRLLAGAGALALGLAGLATTANADETVDGHETANINFDALGSITVTKYAQSAADATEHKGTELDPTPSLDLLDGVEFTVRPVDIDLETNAGWDAVNALDAYAGGDVATAGDDEYALGTAVAGTTGENGAPTGVVVFDDLPVGVYLVQETNIGENPITNRAAPFYVAIPLPQDSGQWLYDVFVYPKNAVTAIEKSVDESAALALGSTVSWPIRVTVPQLTAGTALETFTVTDTLDHRLGFDDVTVTPAELVAETHYTVAQTAGTDADGNVTVVVDFTEAGLAALEGLQGTDVVVTVNTTVNAIGDGTIVNDALVNVNDYEGTTNEVHSKWGAIKVFKYASVTENGEASEVPLEGAEFQVFATEADALALENPISVVNGPMDIVTTFVSDAQGNIVIPGLLVDNTSGERTYWVVETKAPAGYDLPSIEDSIHEVLVKAGSIEGVEALPVLNVLVPLIGLPLTGGAGTVAFSVAGLTLIGIAVAVAVVVGGRRRAAATSQA